MKLALIPFALLLIFGSLVVIESLSTAPDDKRIMTYWYIAMGMFVATIVTLYIRRKKL